MGDSNLSICQLCKEPVWNFICPDCIAKGINSFLPSHFSDSFRQFHSSFMSHFSDSGFSKNTCLSCKTESLAACPYCYTSEVHSWLENENAPMAEKFMSVFSFGFDNHTFQNSNTIPIKGDVKEEEFGVCDECGEYADELMFLEGEWICKGCGKTI